MADTIKTLHRTEHGWLTYSSASDTYHAITKDDDNPPKGYSDYFKNADAAYSFIVKQLNKLGYSAEAKEFSKAQNENYEKASADNFDKNKNKKHWYWG